jgi:hypothetical protein
VNAPVCRECKDGLGGEAFFSWRDGLAQGDHERIEGVEV